LPGENGSTISTSFGSPAGGFFGGGRFAGRLSTTGLAPG
jgi:hypothetical protein